jgi:diguanylate cyclase (GGDEF)-like protein
VRIRTNIFLSVGLLVMAGILIALLPANGRQVAAVVSICVLGTGLFYVTYSMMEDKNQIIETVRYELAIAQDKLRQVRLDYENERQIDHLTKCFNEHYFQNEAVRFIGMNKRSGIKFSLVLLRIDQLSAFLAEEGQQGGNELLKVIANLLRRGLRETDMVARLDDDSFALLLSDAADEDAVMVTERLMKLTRQIRHKGLGDGVITISTGITSYRKQSELGVLRSEASEALEVAIDAGGDRIAVFAQSESVTAY